MPLDIADIAKKSIDKLYPRLYGDLLQALDDFDKNVYQVGERFFNEINRLQQRETEYQDMRCCRAAEYFLKQIETILQPLLPRLSVELDNRKIQESLSVKRAELNRLFSEKQDTLACVCKNKAFVASDYLRAKSARFADLAEAVSKNRKKAESQVGKGGRKQSTKVQQNSDTATSSVPEGCIPNAVVAGQEENPFSDRLVEALKAWRTAKYKEEQKPAYMVLSQKALIGIAEKMPRTEAELLSVNGVGKKKAAQYGEEILSLITTCLGD